MECRFCLGENVIKSGKVRNKQRYKCKECKKYFVTESVELIIIGLPKNWDESDTHGTPLVEAAIKKLKKEFSLIPLKTVDERYTSKMAKDAMLQMGMKKKDRRIKGNVDIIAATIILQEYLQSIQ